MTYCEQSTTLHIFAIFLVEKISYRKRQPRILSFRYICSGCHDRSLRCSRLSSASPSNQALRSRLADYLSYHKVSRMYYHLLSNFLFIVIKISQRNYQLSDFYRFHFIQDLEWLFSSSLNKFWRFLDVQGNLPFVYKSLHSSSIDVGIKRECLLINLRSLALRFRYDKDSTILPSIIDDNFSILINTF